MLSISTSWFKDETDDISEWLRDVKTLGFDAVELSYRLSKDQIAVAEEVLGEIGLKVSSIHNFCPLPDDEPTERHPSNYYRLSSLDDHERAQAVKWTNIACDTAKRLGAEVVVIHAGMIACEDVRTPEIFELYCDGKKDTDEFKTARENMLKIRDEKKSRYIDNLKASLTEVTNYAKQIGIKIGLETRYYPMEIPNFDEIDLFLNMFDASVMGYWHDFGHAEMNSRLGICPHDDYLKNYQSRLIGVHIHGIKGRRDHLAPFDGDFDLNQYLSYLKSDTIKVIESKTFASKDQIASAVSQLKN